MNQLADSEGRAVIGIETDSGKCIDAVCINCNKRFTSIRAISMHLRMTAACHIVNFTNYGNYNMKTGFKEISLP